MSDVNFDLLDQSVEDLVELEGFEPFPPGTYRLSIDFAEKEVNDKPAVEFSFVNRETIELANLNDTAPEPGKTGSILYMLYKSDGEPNEVGQGQLRELLGVLRESFGGDSSRDVMRSAKGAEAICTLKVRKDRKDKDRAYNSLAAIVVE